MAPQRTEKFSEDSFYSFVGRVKENKKEMGRIEILARAGRLYFQVMQEAVSEHRGKSCEVVPPERSCSAEMRPAFPLRDCWLLLRWMRGWKQSWEIGGQEGERSHSDSLCLFQAAVPLGAPGPSCCLVIRPFPTQQWEWVLSDAGV